MSRAIVWKGAKKLDDALKLMVPHLEKKILDQAARAGLAHFVRVVKTRIPTDSKDDVHLKKSISIRKAKKTKNRVSMRVGILGRGDPENVKDARKYAHIFEFGSRYVRGTHVFTNTFENEAENMLKAAAEKIKAGLMKYGSSRNGT